MLQHTSPAVINNKKKSRAIEYFIHALNQLHPISPEIVQYFVDHTTFHTLRKKKLVLKEGVVCEHLYFICKGAIRGFIKEPNKEVTTWISIENEMVTSIARLTRPQPSLEFIQTIENTEVLAMTISDLEQLYICFPEFNIVGRKLLQIYYAHAEERAFVARLTTAKDRYNYFIKNKSHLANRIPLKYIASYLGVTLETVSKVRSRLSLKNALP